MVKLGQLFEECRRIIARNDEETSFFDTKCLFEDILEKRNIHLLPDTEIPLDTARKLIRLAQQRSEGYPLQYILGQWEFFGYPFAVGEGVLIPRPDTETLVEQIIGLCREKGLVSPKIVDLCSGSGCIAVTLKKELPNSEVYAVELSDKAYKYLVRNIMLNKVKVSVIRGDVLSKETVSRFKDIDVIVSNPPYLTAQDMAELQTEVRHEPGSALFGGEDGLDFYRKITELWSYPLKRGGILAYEFGQGQHDAVTRIMEKNGFIDIRLSRDCGGIIRSAAGFLI